MQTQAAMQKSQPEAHYKARPSYVASQPGFGSFKTEQEASEGSRDLAP